MSPRSSSRAGNSSPDPYPVAQKSPNAWGHFDLRGMFCEWWPDKHRARRPAWRKLDPDRRKPITATGWMTR